MKPKKIALKAMRLGWIALLPVAASALERGSMGTLSVGGGIAMPSYSTAGVSNAAGLVLTPGVNLQLQGGSDSTVTNTQFRGGLAYGNGNFGIGAGGMYFNPSASMAAYYGLGFKISGLQTSFGVSGLTFVSPVTTSVINAGMMITPGSMFSFGFTATDLTNGIGELGAGLGIHFSPNVSLIVDSAFSSSLAFLTVEPALKVGNENASLMVAYGSGTGSTQLVNNEVAAGAALRLGSKVNWELYYNKFATYYTSFSIKL